MSESLPPPVTSIPKKKSPWLFVGLGCLVILIIGVVGIVVAVSFGAKKIVQMSKDVSANPEKFAAELVVKANPELEMVSSDPASGVMTIREKSTGKETTLSYKDAAAGKFTLEQDGKKVTIDASQNGQTSQNQVITLNDDDKTTIVSTGSTAEKLPSWVPVYPGVTISSDGGFHVKSDEGTTGSVSGTTKDAVTKVSAYYKSELEKAGYTCEEMKASAGDVEMSSVSAKNENLGQEITVSIQKDKAQPDANVTLVYQSKKP